MFVHHYKLIMQFQKEEVYAIKPQKQESSAMTHLSLSLSLGVCSFTSTNIKVCNHLSLGVCPYCTTTTSDHYEIKKQQEEASSSTKKRKLGKQETSGSRKKKGCKEDQGRRMWGYSLELMLYDDPWKIKKVLKESDLGNMSRLLLGRDLAEELVLPVLGADADDLVDRGTQVCIFDVDTNSTHSLIFKRWVSSRSYVLMGKWVKDFVNRRALKNGDEIRLHWDHYNNRFNFSVLQANHIED